jgi:hypothetical protein
MEETHMDYKPMNKDMAVMIDARKSARERINAGYDARKASGTARAEALLSAKGYHVGTYNVPPESEGGLAKGGWTCPECQQVRPDDDRVKAGMKCAQCAY